ncbi:hypothetical protein LCGC14_2156340, partial [marine sediment metagenome]
MKKKILTLGFSAFLITPVSHAVEQLQIFTTLDSEVYTETQPVT